MGRISTGSHILRHAQPVGDQAQKVGVRSETFGDKKSEHDHSGKADGEFRVLASLIRWSSSFPRLRRFLWEYRNFLHRIGIVWNNSDSYRCPSSFAFLEASSGCVYENTRSNGRIECIRKLASMNPSTPLDWRLWMESWDQGVEWALRNLDFDSPSTSEHKALLAWELSYKGPRNIIHAAPVERGT
jgi:hypothetical protein